MNMFATLLFKQPAILPKGRSRFISADRVCSKPGKTSAQERLEARNRDARLRNIEKVFNAIEDGKETIYKISDATELSVCTVKKAIDYLEDENRITRDARKSQHRFSTKATKCS